MATAKSGRPSPFTSPNATLYGLPPVAKVCWAAKLGLVAPAAVVFSNTDTVADPTLPTTRSGRPSPFTSATATEGGLLPVAKVCWAAKVGVVAPAAVVFSSTDTVAELWLATIRSGRPSPLTSATAAERGKPPVANVCWEAKLGVPLIGASVFSTTDTVLEPRFAVAMSGRPSPFTSPTTRELGPLPVAKVCCAAKLGVVAPAAVVFSSTDTELELPLATARSRRPSPFTSFNTIEVGVLPVAKVCWGAKLGAAAPAAVVLNSTDTLAESPLATARSSRPSPFTSPSATEVGLLPVAKVCWAAKIGVVTAPAAVVFSSTDTLAELSLATARSDRPSPFTSPNTTEIG